MKYKSLENFLSLHRLEIACTATLSIKALLLLPFASTLTGAPFGTPPGATFATTTSSRLVQLQKGVEGWRKKERAWASGKTHEGGERERAREEERGGELIPFPNSLISDRRYFIDLG